MGGFIVSEVIKCFGAFWERRAVEGLKEGLSRNASILPVIPKSKCAHKPV